MIRDDIGSRLVHLTKGETDDAAARVLMTILDERILRGGYGCIKGPYRCVCFSEAPVSKLSHILANPAAHQMRYKPFGVMVDKRWLFEQGGRPVIYQTDAEFEQLPETHRFRHVRYEPGVVDFTWEREWRIRADELALDPERITVVVPNRAWEEWAQERHVSKVARWASLTGFPGPRQVTAFPWHFIVLEDLGVEIPSVLPPERSTAV